MPQKKKLPSSNVAGNRKVPAWITDHFTDSLNSHEQLLQIVEISARGISILRGMPKVVDVLSRVDGKSNDSDRVERLARAEKEASLAVAEAEKGFPVLHGFAVVALWSWMEHFTKGLVALWLMHRREAISVPAVQKLRVRLGDYLQLSKFEQAHLLVELLEQDLASPLKRGATRFESLLEPFNLTFPLPSGCGQTLFELQQVRNAIAHRNGRADRRLRTDCPWLKLKLNQPIHVSHQMLRAYAEASGQYLLCLLYRIGDVYGHNLRPDEQKAK